MRLILACLLSFLWLTSSAQTGLEKLFGGIGNDYAHAVETTYDGGIITILITNSYGSGGSDIYLTKMDRLGLVVCAKSFGGTGNELLEVAILEASDSGIVVAGVTESFGSSGRDGYIFKADKYATLLWDIRYSNPLDDDFRTVIESSTDELLIAGTVNDVIGSSDGVLIKLTADGNPVWAKAIGGSGADNIDRVKELPDSNYILAGNTESWGPSLKNFYLVKTDTAGSIIWESVYGGTGIDYITDIEVLPNGNIIACGGSDSWGNGGIDGQLLMYDSNGALQWIKTYGGTADDHFREIEVLPSGNILVHSYTASFGSGQNDLMLVKTDASGNIILAKTFGGAGNEEIGTSNRSMVLAGDSGVIVVGWSDSYGFGGTDGLVILSDTSGSQYCNDVTSQVVVGIPTATFGSSNSSVVNSGTFSDPSTAMIDFIGMDSTMCNCAGGPVAGFSVDTSNGMAVQFTDTSSSSATSWQWDFGDSQQSTLQSPLHTYNDTGWYYVCLIITDDCGSDAICDSIYVAKPAGIKEHSQQQFTIHPNPTTGVFTVTGQGLVQVFDLVGKEVTGVRRKVSAGAMEIDLSSYAAGIYFVRIGERTSKLVLSK